MADLPDLRAPQTRAGFHTTRWSLVALVGNDQSPDSAEALNDLCRSYWRPIYAEIRRRSHAAADAQDLTQEFFAHLLRMQSFGHADQQRGRFRSFLLAALDHLLADHWRDKNALKRGGGIEPLSLDVEEGENWYLEQLVSPEATPAQAFDQSWALILMDRALAALKEEYESGGRAALFAASQPFLAMEEGADGYKSLCEQFGMSVEAARVAVHRLRKRFRQCLREQVEMTVSDPAETDSELRHVFGL